MRRGFTLVELLVVITIILILSLISLQVAGALIDQARESNTRAMLGRLQALHDHQAQRFERLSHRSPVYVNDRAHAAKLIFPAASPTALKIIARKLWYRDSLATLDTIEDDGAVMVDGWKRPIRRYVFASRLWHENAPGSPLTPGDLERARLAGLPPATLATSLLKDPDDPLGDCAGLALEAQGLNTPATYYLALFVSAGADGKLGLFEPDDVANNGPQAAPIPGAAADLDDNVWSIGRIGR